MKKGYFVLFIITTIMVSCSDTLITPTVSDISPANPPMVSSTDSPETPTLQSTNTSISTPFITPIPSTLIPSITPIPTLTRMAARVEIFRLLETNNGCEYPCWWGIVPGQTRWEQASPLFEHLGLSPIHPSDDVWAYPAGSDFFPAPDDRFFLGQGFTLNDQVVDTITVFFGGDGYITLTGLLTDYGTPTDVYIRTFSNVYEGMTPFYIVLFYQNQGIMTYFESLDAKISGDNVMFCNDNESITYLALWPASSNRTYAEVLDRGVFKEHDLASEVHPYLTLQESTDLTIDDFYTLFTDLEPVTCLETPAELWPGQFE